MKSLFRTCAAFAVAALISSFAFLTGPVSVASAASWQGMITDAGTNPSYRVSSAVSQAEPWTECGPRAWHRAKYITMTADQAIKTLGYGQACGYDGYRGGTDKGSDDGSAK